MNNVKHKPILDPNGIEQAGIFYYIKDKKEVGQVEYRYFPSFEGYILSDFEIDEEYRGRGYGTFLIKIVLLHLRRDNPEMEIRAYVDGENVPATKLFKKMDFFIDKEYVNGNKTHIVVYKAKE